MMLFINFLIAINVASSPKIKGYDFTQPISHYSGSLMDIPNGTTMILGDDPVLDLTDVSTTILIFGEPVGTGYCKTNKDIISYYTSLDDVRNISISSGIRKITINAPQVKDFQIPISGARGRYDNLDWYLTLSSLSFISFRNPESPGYYDTLHITFIGKDKTFYLAGHNQYTYVELKSDCKLLVSSQNIKKLTLAPNVKVYIDVISYYPSTTLTIESLSFVNDEYFPISINNNAPPKIIINNLEMRMKPIKKLKIDVRIIILYLDSAYLETAKTLLFEFTDISQIAPYISGEITHSGSNTAGLKTGNTVYSAVIRDNQIFMQKARNLWDVVDPICIYEDAYESLCQQSGTKIKFNINTISDVLKNSEGNCQYYAFALSEPKVITMNDISYINRKAIRYQSLNDNMITFIENGEKEIIPNVLFLENIILNCENISITSKLGYGNFELIMKHSEIHGNKISATNGDLDLFSYSSSTPTIILENMVIKLYKPIDNNYTVFVNDLTIIGINTFTHLLKASSSELVFANNEFTLTASGVEYLYLYDIEYPHYEITFCDEWDFSIYFRRFSFNIDHITKVNINTTSSSTGQSIYFQLNTPAGITVDIISGEKYDKVSVPIYFDINTSTKLLLYSDYQISNHININGNMTIEAKPIN